MRRSTSRCSAQSRTTSPAGRYNCGIGSSSQLATVIGAMNRRPRARPARRMRGGISPNWVPKPSVHSRLSRALHRSIRPPPPLEVARWSCVRDAQGTSLGPSRTPSRRRPPRPTAQVVPGDEDRQCVGPIGSQSARQTPQPFVQLSEPTSDAVRTWSASPDQLSDDAGRRSRTSANDRVFGVRGDKFPSIRAN